MPIHTATVFLLRKISFRNTSYIVDVLTRNRGRVSLIAKGARREKSGFFGRLDYCSKLEIVYIDKKEAMGVLTECDIIDYFPEIHRSRRRLGCSMLFARLIREFVEAQEAGCDLFDLCSSFFSDMHSCDEKEIITIYLKSVLVLLDLTGFRPDVTSCAVCGVKTEDAAPLIFNTEESEMVCRTCLSEKKEKKYLELSLKSCIIIKALQAMEHADDINSSEQDIWPVERFLLEFASSILHKDLRQLSLRLYDVE
ncbi:DNA repair protein RecO [Planctomycetota bacterium]